MSDPCLLQRVAAQPMAHNMLPCWCLVVQVEDASAELAALGLPLGFGKHEVGKTL
jgi:hypothetical protein